MAELEIEASNMAAIYQGAHITLAATDSVDAHGGLIREVRIPALQFFQQLGQRPEYNVQTIIALQPKFKTVAATAAETDSTTIRLSGQQIFHDRPINDRGWTLQELAISHRTIHFGKDQLWWQCLSLFQSEDGIFDTRTFKSLGLPYSINCYTFDFSDTWKSHAIWLTWVTSFCKRKLTFETDRAPAMAGLVDFYQSKTGHTPLLGLWKETIQYYLSSNFEQQPPSEYAGPFPSWSWLSMHGRRYEHVPQRLDGSETSALKVVECHVHWEGRPFSSRLFSREHW
jgi:hypothetical protein